MIRLYGRHTRQSDKSSVNSHIDKSEAGAELSSIFLITDNSAY